MKLTNPYAGDTSPVHRTTINVPERVVAFLKQHYCRDGVIQHTINTLLYKLEHELRRIESEFTEYDSARYADAVAGCTIILGPAARSGPTVEAVARDDGRGTTSAPCVVTPLREQPADTSGNATKRSNKGRKAVKTGGVV